MGPRLCDAFDRSARMTDEQNPFIVSKREVHVKLQLSTGQQVSGFIHCNVRSAEHHGRERVKDVLNGPSAMVPIHLADGSYMLFNKAYIEVVELDHPDLAEEGETDLTDHRPIELLLADGMALHGTILVSTPPERSRTLDFLNRGERFFYLETEDGSRVIALQHVVSARDGTPA
jgi:hypothetical protein